MWDIVRRFFFILYIDLVNNAGKIYIVIEHIHIFINHSQTDESRQSQIIGLIAEQQHENHAVFIPIASMNYIYEYLYIHYFIMNKSVHRRDT